MKLYRNMDIEEIADKKAYTVSLTRLIRLIRYTDTIFFVSDIYHWDDIKFPHPIVTAGEQVTFENLCKLIDNCSTIEYITVMK